MQLQHILGPSPLYTNTFLLVTAAGHGIAIDPSAPPARYTDALAEAKATLTHILLTHGHYDHVGAVEALKQAAPGAVTVYLDPADCKGDALYPLKTADAGYTDGGHIRVDELDFTTWHTPGHTQGSWCFYCEGNLFTGDTLFAGSCGRVDMPGGSAPQMMQSLARLAGLPLGDATRVLPGHEGFSTLGEERRHNPYLQGAGC
ncbi:MAG: MBL fold metallo-hydrolase [Gemmiger sp.]|nr:MBL fold metallo-hydrolase [Gemmiger sp.]